MQNNSENFKITVFTSIVWKFLERIAAQGISFVVTIILARLLLPEDYGQIALVTVFITFGNVFVTSGLPTALIQKKDADALDFSTIFHVNLMISAILYLVLFFLAPYVSAFYQSSALTPIIRVLSFSIPVAAFQSVQQAYVAKNMLFKKFFFSTIGGTILSGVVGVMMALNGFGVWALVAQQLTNLIVDTSVLWITVRWRPQASFSLERLKGMFAFGWKLLVSSLLDVFSSNLQQLIIGKKYSLSELSFYNKGREIPTLVITNINSSLDSVLLPAISKHQEDTNLIKTMTRRVVKISCYVVWPMMVGIAIIAEPLILILLTEKWIGCVPYLQIFCFIYALFPIHTANLNAIKSVGRSDMFLLLEIAKTVVCIAILVVSMQFGVMGIAYGVALSGVISMIINVFPNARLIHYGLFEQIANLFPTLLLCSIMAICVYSISFLGCGVVLQMLLQIVCGILVYVLCSILFKSEDFRYIMNFFKLLLKR